MIAGLRTLAGKQSSRGPGARTGLEASDVHCNCLNISCSCLVWAGQQSARTITLAAETESCWIQLQPSGYGGALMLQVVGPFYPRLMIFVLFHSHCLNCVSTCGWWRWAEPGMNIPVSRLQSICSTISTVTGQEGGGTSVRILLRTENKCSPSSVSAAAKMVRS